MKEDWKTKTDTLSSSDLKRSGIFASSSSTELSEPLTDVTVLMWSTVNIKPLYVCISLFVCLHLHRAAESENDISWKCKAEVECGPSALSPELHPLIYCFFQDTYCYNMKMK